MAFSQQAGGIVIEPLVGIGEVRFGMTIDQARQILGEPQRSNDRTYEYTEQGFAILTGADGTIAAIKCEAAEAGSGAGSGVTATSACRTAEGIGIGSTKDDITTAYGEPSRTQRARGGLVLRYAKIRAQFVLQDDKVVSMAFNRKVD